MNEKKAKAPQLDKREAYYRNRVLQPDPKYSDFHRPTVEAMLNLFFTYDTIQTFFAREIGAHGLSTSGFNVLMILKRAGQQGHPLHELGELLLVSRANVTGLVDSLEQKKLVERVAGESDRRIKLARITPAGMALLDKILPNHYREARRLFSGMTNAEKCALSKLLEKLRRQAQRPVNGKHEG